MAELHLCQQMSSLIKCCACPMCPIHHNSLPLSLSLSFPLSLFLSFPVFSLCPLYIYIYIFLPAFSRRRSLRASQRRSSLKALLNLL